MNINKKNKIHIIGIGGIGMSGIAEILHGMGYKVQGSDISKSKNVLRLNKKRIKVLKIIDKTPESHNGCRAPKKRRL